ncbi:helix-turn-helix domain-containing protein [Amycolatopsis sp. cg5]|uniref:helix-turn-helix domain-containing protein n=1 Tax=Amycolatopsis sp. cg5 TaxID=3238802 RepID=UPI003525696B
MAAKIQDSRPTITPDERKLLTVLADSARGLSCHEAAEQSGFSVSETYRLLSALSHKEFTVKESQERTVGMVTVVHFASAVGRDRLVPASVGRPAK